MPPSRETFAGALDAAISDAGLTLDRVREHLAARGVSVSRSALVYWRMGRSKPEREASLRAVVELEQVLGLTIGALTSLLGPDQPRCLRQGSRTPLLERRRLWPSVRQTALELPPEDDVHLRSVHDELVVDDDQRERLLRVRVVAEATTDGVTRMPVYYQTEDITRPPPRFAAVFCCRAGRVRRDVDGGLLVAELFFDRELAAGDVAAVEYELVFSRGLPTLGYHRRLTRPASMYTCQVQFGRTVPRSVERFERRDLAAPRRKVHRLRLTDRRVVAVAAREVGAGIIGVEWAW
ncbi:XRE family transcriptional regulator [Amycolatopsis sp. NPDC004169]|uniref:XRE family transcriptional regulator n=1 Tax=Amycolatopsis sp. NPDC004169 TaxID=3154453 RepID=UPI0033AFF1FD